MSSEVKQIDRATSTACAHCGLPSPPPESEGQLTFCCAGCRGAYELIRGWGLEDYYAIRDRVQGGTVAQPVESAGEFDALDDPSLFGVHPPVACGPGLLRCRLAVSGLHCGACAWLIERYAALQPSIQSARVRLNDHTVELVYRPDVATLGEIGLGFSRLGYRLSPWIEDDQQNRQASENRRLLVDIAIAGFCAANAMWLAIALYAGMFSGMAQEHAAALRWAGVLLGLVAVAVPGRTFFRGAIASIRTRSPHMDLPVALGLSVGAGAGAASVVANRGEVYFDSVASLVFLLLLGRWVQFRQQRRAAASVALLMRLTPRLATRIDGSGAARRVPVDQLRTGDVVRVDAGETIPADGVVLRGESQLDRSLVTGESRPVVRKPGESVEAGCGNLESVLEMRVTAVGADSRVGRITRLIEDAAGDRAPIVQLADSVGGWFVIAVIALAIITLAIWLPTDPFQAADHTVALLIVACPCALALATPLAIAVSVGRLARRQVLIRGGDTLERLVRPGIVWFDKTGTLTEGRLVLRTWEGDERSLVFAAAIEADSAHPVAVAIRDAAAERRLQTPTAQQVKQVTGGGVSGTVQGHQVLVGNERFLKRLGVNITEQTQRRIDQAARGGSPLLVAVDQRITAMGTLGNRLRHDAASVVEMLRRSGWEVGILSGDHPGAVHRIANELSIPADRVVAGVGPEVKLRTVEESREPGRTVMMVGDGVNDAAALAAADVGVAIQGGAAASLEAAPVYLQSGRLASLADLLHASQRTVSTIRRNFAISLGYNGLAVGLAMAGYINPLLAAVLMPLSSLSVLSSVMISRTFPQPRDDSTLRLTVQPS